MKFVEFTGNERVKEQLSFLIESKRLPHAIIIEGEEGIGKRTLAREIALNLFCRGENKPCLNCPQCSKILKGVHPDFIEYTAENRRSAFHIKKVREIRDDVYVRPNEADYKIYVLANAQSMTAQAQNAILKVLEEPPSYVIFILTATNRSYMLDTVLSRSVVITLEGVESTKGAEYISKKYNDISYDDAYNALELSGGNIGKALESLKDGRMTELESLAEKTALCAAGGDEYEMIKIMSAFSGDNKSLELMLPMLKSIFASALIYSSNDGQGGKNSSGDTARILSSRLSQKKLLRLAEACDSLSELLKSNINNKIIITKTCADLRKAAGR